MEGEEEQDVREEGEDAMEEEEEEYVREEEEEEGGRWKGGRGGGKWKEERGEVEQNLEWTLKVHAHERDNWGAPPKDYWLGHRYMPVLRWENAMSVWCSPRSKFPKGGSSVSKFLMRTEMSDGCGNGFEKKMSG